MDLIFQIPLQYCSLQNQALLLPQYTATAEYHSHFSLATSFFLDLLVTALSSSLGAWWTLADLGASALCVISFFLFILPKEFSRRDTGMGCHFLFYGPCFIRTLDYDLFHLQWPYTVWLLASLSCTNPFVMTKL